MHVAELSSVEDEPNILADSNSNVELLRRKEQEIRESADQHKLKLLLVNGYSALYVFLFYLVSLETILGIALSVALTIYTFVRIDNDLTYDGSIMSWTLLSFAVVTPIGAAVRMAFTRREQALVQTSQMRSTVIELYIAHSTWDWCKSNQSELSGRKASDTDWLQHSDSVEEQILGICNDVTRYLTLPTSTRSRHKTTRSGKKEAGRINGISRQLEQSIVVHFAKLSALCETLKCEGLPSNEATRIRQWERIVLESVERLRNLKMYRSPQGLRSFARLFSILLPPFYAPYYAQIARDLNSLSLAIVVSITISVTLTSLFETVSQLEDPFVVASFLDGVNVQQELLDDLKPLFVTLRKTFFPGGAKAVKMPNKSDVEKSE